MVGAWLPTELDDCVAIGAVGVGAVGVDVVACVVVGARPLDDSVVAAGWRALTSRP